MSYPLPTLASFSDAIAAIHSSARGAVSRAEQTINLDHSEASHSDLLYLRELLETHRKVVEALVTPSSGASNLHTPEKDREFTSLRAVGLTPRECEILHWVAEGKQDAEIAVIVGCAPRTVSKHIEHLLAKLGAETRLAAVHTAQEWMKQNV